MDAYRVDTTVLLSNPPHDCILGWISMARAMKKRRLADHEIVAVGIHVIRHVVRQILMDVQDDPTGALETVTIGKHKKPALRVDVNAEDSFKRELHRYHTKKFKNVKVFGEESLRDKDLDLSSKKELTVLVDAVDGTDLVERGFSNWCSAAAFFDPRRQPGERLLAAFVGVPTLDVPEVYFATSEGHGAFVQRNSERVMLAGPSKVRMLRRASICYYGQKVDNFLSLAGGVFTNNLTRVNDRAKKSGKKLDLRIYNMAGIPMMIKMADHRNRAARGVDVVMEVGGQKPHDCVPGLFIAKKAGAVIRNLDGTDFSYQQMENLLLRPAAAEQTYVAASTDKLCGEVLSLLKS
jgi:fructose-1,6-bisphosphatase/inositol monophosphatase family enzyme